MQSPFSFVKIVYILPLKNYDLYIDGSVGKNVWANIIRTDIEKK